MEEATVEVPENRKKEKLVWMNFCFSLLSTEALEVTRCASVTPGGSYSVALAKMHMPIYLMVIKSFK